MGTNIACLDEEQGKILVALLNLLIPPDIEMPGAGEVFIAENEPAWLLDVLSFIGQEAQSQFGLEFPSLSVAEQAKLVGQFKRKDFRLFNKLVTEVMQCYYQNGKVLKAIRMETRPPFPDGYFVPDGDFALLEPVFERSKMYRS